MNNKKVILTLSVLTTPFIANNLTDTNVAKANTEYTLTQSVKAYETAQNAAKQGNTTKTYKSGTYYVYKEHNGMVNISKTKGKAGAWINPANNKSVSEPLAVTTTKTQQTNVKTSIPKSPTPSTIKKTNSTTYTLNNDVKVYNNAALAKSKKGSSSTYKSGNYFIFKEFNGMMNISKTSGRAGAWINPTDNKAIIAKTKPATSITTNTSNNTQTQTIKNNITQGANYVLKNKINVYNTAADARNSSNPTSTYNQGTYYIYKTYNGMVNISRIRGKSGAWINPQDTGVNIVKTENQITKPPYEVSDELSTLKNEYNKLFGKLGGQRSVYVTPADSTEFFEYNSSNLQPSASSIKLFILAAAYNKNNKGQFNLNTKYTVKSSDISKGSLFTEKLIGKTQTMDQYLKFMMEKSDNGATNILIRHLGGLSAVQNEIKELGYTKTKLNHYMNDNKAINSGKVNYVTAQESADLIKRIYNKNLINKEKDTAMLDKISRNYWNLWLTANIKNQAKTWSKPGGSPTLPINNDTAVIKVDQRAYVVSVLNNSVKSAHTAAAKFGQAIVNVLKKK